tara:strand:- start:1953 stop:2951 length:999 start_codon:yes stop_codon:yes gene_type:complete
MKIFISIASYQDPLLFPTIFSAYNSAQNKENLIFSICDQSDEGIDIDAIPFRNQIHYEHVDPLLSKGPCWARSRLQSFYQGEEYFLQIDSHTIFLDNWDAILIERLKKIEANSKNDAYFKKPIITSYPRAFEVLDYENYKFKLFTSDKRTQVLRYRKEFIFSKGSYSRQVGIPTQNNNIEHGILIAAGCIFSKGLFIREIPYDPRFYFYGEELSIALRAFTNGYSIFHIPEIPLFHLYTDVKNLTRKLHWDPEDDKERAVKWSELDRKSLERLDLLFTQNLEGEFGLGRERTLSDYSKMSGIDLKNKKILDFSKATQSEFLESIDWKVNPLT